MFDEQPDGDPHGECALEISRLQSAVRDLLRICRDWEPDHSSGEERQKIMRAQDLLPARDARVEPVVGPLSGARSDLPPMPPPAASLPVSAPAGVRMLTPADARQLLCVRDYLDAADINAAVYALTAFADHEMTKLNPWEWVEELAAMSATTKEN